MSERSKSVGGPENVGVGVDRTGSERVLCDKSGDDAGIEEVSDIFESRFGGMLRSDLVYDG